METEEKLEQESPQWQASDNQNTIDDPLLGCLELLAKILHKPHSGQSLIAGLPLVDNKLTPKLFSRAAERAGLSSKVVKRPLRKISNLVLPAVLLLENSTACVVLKFNKKTAKVIFPETGEGETEISLKELNEQYAGYAIFVKPVHQFDERTQHSEIPRTKHWFWGTILRFWPIYGEVFIASILVNSFALASPLFVMNVYDRVVPNHAIETLWVLAIGVGTVFFFDLLLRTLRGYFIDMAGKKADVILSSTIFEKVMGVKMASRSNSVGSFANNMHEFESFREFFTSATLTTLIDLPFMFLFIFVIWTIAGELAYIPLFVIPVAILVSLIIQIPLGRTIKQLFQHSGQKSATLIETLTGLETIKSLAAEIRNNTHRQVEQSVRLSWNALETVNNQINYFETYVDSSEKSRDAYQQQFSLGQRTLLDLLDSENEVFSARKSLVNAQYDQLFAMYRILNSTGSLLQSLQVGLPEAAQVASK